MRTKLLLSVLLSIFFCSGFCQPIQNVKSEDEINTLYNKKLQASSNLYSGPQYIEQNYPQSGSPFFSSDSLRNGWISYDGHLYTDVLLQWDVFQNYVITLSLKENSKLILRNDLIDSFYFSGHLVKTMKADKELNLLQAGFYEFLYNGKTAVIAIRKKTNMGIIQGGSMVYDFTSKNKIYVKKEGIYFLISNKKDILKLFPKDKSAIKRLVRKAALNWRKNLDQSASIAAQYHDNPTH